MVAKRLMLRGSDRLLLEVPVIERPHDLDRLGDIGDPETNRISQLGIVGIAIDDAIAEMVPGLRIPSGVIVAGRSQGSRGADVALSAGDIIHTLNGRSISDLKELRSSLDELEPRSAVVLQVERAGKLSFVSFQLD
jgi:serine protease Do